MATPLSPNCPHVRITPETRDDLRLLAYLEQKSQGEVVAELVRQRLVEVHGDPQLVVQSRQNPKGEVVTLAPPVPQQRRTPPAPAAADVPARRARKQ